MALPTASLLAPGRVVPPAPLPAAEVARAAAPFGQSTMLPRAAYLDEQVLAWEQEHLLTGWLCLGRSTEIAPKGMRAESVGRSGVLLVRDADGELRAFENACRHRGHELLPCGGSSESTRAIVCPYHAWSYRHDGSMIGAPGFRELPGFDTSLYSLKPVRVEEWHGWVFVDTSGEAPDFQSHIGQLETIVEPYDAERLVTPVIHEYDVEANWKVIIENYQECYHCPSIHPELCRVSPPDSGDNLELEGNWIGGNMELRTNAATMSLDGHSEGTVMARLDEVESRSVMYVAVMPNLLISLHPDYIMSHLLTPVSADRTRIRCSWAFPPEVAEKEGFDPSYAVDFWDITNRQDWAACEAVQRGMKTPHYEPGPLAPAEDGVYHFTHLMARAYQGQGVNGVTVGS
jgi:Rieske 2Fe-2S family protein